MKKQSAWRVEKKEHRIPKRSKKKSFVPNDTFFNANGRKEVSNMEKKGHKQQPTSNLKQNTGTRKPKRSPNRLENRAPEGIHYPKRSPGGRDKKRNRLFKENRVKKTWENSLQIEVGSGPQRFQQNTPNRGKLVELAPDRNKNFTPQVYPRRDEKRAVREKKGVTRGQEYLKRPQYKEESDLQFEEPSKPHNPWLQNGQRRGLVDQNLNQAAFHIYPVNRKQPKQENISQISLETQLQDEWKPVTRVINDPKKNKREYIQHSFGVVNSNVVTHEPSETNKEAPTIELTAAPNAGENIFAAPKTNTRYKNKEVADMSNACLAEISQIQKPVYNKYKKTSISTNEKVQVSFY